MYDVDNLQLEHSEQKKLQTIQMRMLEQTTQPAPVTTQLSDAEPKKDDPTPHKPAKNDNLIHIGGNGVAGIATAFLFLLPILFAFMAMQAIFVNTKTIEHPLLMGKIEY
jgi:hypothetical protein